MTIKMEAEEVESQEKVESLESLEDLTVLEELIKDVVKIIDLLYNKIINGFRSSII